MIEHFLNSLIPTITNMGVFSYWLVGLIFFCEALVFVGLIIPGAIISVILGALASRGVFHLGDLMFFAAAGFFLGDWLSYYLGRRGTGLFKNENRILKYAHLEKGENFFKKHGSKSVLLGRFIGFMRPLTPFIAGLSKMKAVRFFPLNTLGIILWVISHFLTGYFFGQALDLVKLWTTRAERFLFFLIIFLGLFYFVRWFISKKGRAFWAILRSLSISGWQVIMANQHVQRLNQKFPKLFSWLGNRFNAKRFSGLTLSSLIIIFLYFLSRLVSLVNAVVVLKSTLVIDNRLESLMHAYRSIVFIKIFFVLSLLGEAKIVIALVLGFSLLLWLYRKKSYILPLWLISTGGALTAYIMKQTIARPRPDQASYLETSFSFPSGHATIAIILYGYLAYFFLRNLKSWNKKINSLFTSLLVIILISFSRIYLGVHYLSDVWGGVWLGLCWLTIGVGFNEYLLYRSRHQLTPEVRGKKLKSLTLAVIIFEIIFFSSIAVYETKKISFAKFELPVGVTTNDILQTFDNLKLDKFSETLDGDTQAPLNFIIAAESDQHLINTFKGLGWYRPSLPNLKTLFGTVKATTLNKDFPRSPIAPAFWQSQVTDFAFEKPTEKNTVRQRHTIKLWQTGFVTPNGKKIFVGEVGLDTGLKWWLAHKLDPNIDSEREYLFNEFNQQQLIASWSRNNFSKPVQNTKKNPNPFYTDGKLYIIDLK